MGMPKRVDRTVQVIQKLDLSINQALEAFGKMVCAYIRRSMVSRTFGSGNDELRRGYRSRRTPYPTALSMDRRRRLSNVLPVMSKYKGIKEARTWYEASIVLGQSGKKLSGAVATRSLKAGTAEHAFEWRRGKHHIASAPGEPPAPDTGTLKKSVNFLVTINSGGWKTIRIFADTPYARALELGYAPRYLAPRPYLRPAIEVFKGELGKLITLYNIRKGGVKMGHQAESIVPGLGAGEKYF